MSYLVLARKWRPMTFDDLVGQDHVSRTISNAIVSGRIAHAFLFTGVRGVGKTTSARILAKSLNCEVGPTPKPCLTCGPCREIADSNDIDVQEIDGASYNGVDEVRRLQESLPYRPSRDRFKIVIVDEVHMLSQNAWNAFLKTLEEPPPHVKFVFATTEAHKVPITILSRCQRYDFKLIAAQAIAERIRFVLQEEKITADETAVALIAREAAGSMRDAMSLLDQAIAWGGDRLVGDEIAQVLGVAGHSTLHELASALVKGQAAGCLSVVAQLADQGFDLVQVARDTLQQLRDLVVVKVCADPERLVELTHEEIARVRELVREAELDDLLRIHLGFSRGFDQVVYAPQQRAALEMLLVRLARRPPLLPVDDLLGRLGDMERRVAGKRGVTMSAPRAPSRAARAVAEPQQTAPAAPRRRTSDPAQPPPSRRRSNLPESEPQAAPTPRTDQAPAESPKPTPPSPPPTPRVPPVQPPPTVGESPAQPPPTLGESPAQPPPTLGESPAPAMPAWRTLLDLVRSESNGLASLLEHVIPLEVTASAVTVGIEAGSFYETQLRDLKGVELLERIARQHFGQPTKVTVCHNQDGASDDGTVFAIDEAERKARFEEQRRELEAHPLVRAAVDELGARIQEIKLK